MRVQLATPGSVPPSPELDRRRIDRFEIGLLALFGAVSLWVLALDVYEVIARGRVWTGTDGFFIVDQLQYLAWIRGASEHLLSANLFVLHPTPSDYFQPAVAISGLISNLGVPPWLALLLWKPVAVLSMFLAVRAYARHSLHGLWSRRAVMVLGLFFGSFTIVYGQFGVVGDLFPGFLSWGYTFGLLAIALMLAALVAYERLRAEGRRLGAWPPVLGFLAGILHPWQGEALILVIAASELALWAGRAAPWDSRDALWRDRALATRHLALPLVTIGAAAVPLVYYAILGKVDMSWGLARDASKHDFSFLSIVLDLAPLLIPAALGYRLRARSFLAMATRTWPLAAVGIYLVSSTGISATPLHAFEGVTVPLAVLAVQGLRATRWRRSPRRRMIGAVAIFAFTVPATAYELAVARQYMAPQPGNANFITRDERDALAYLEHDPIRGGVLTRFYLGALVPARTGRRTFVGDCLWSQPGCIGRAQTVQALLDGALTPKVARAFVSAAGARFALSDCQEPHDLRHELGSLVTGVERFGCATIWELG